MSIPETIYFDEQFAARDPSMAVFSVKRMGDYIEYRRVVDCEWKQSTVSGVDKFGDGKYDTECGRDYVEYATGFCSCGGRIVISNERNHGY